MGLPFPALDDQAAMRCRITGPTLAPWGRHGTIERCFNPLKDWAERAENVRGCALNCGHYLPEEAPDEVLLELMKFLP
jgi:haloacetate dehalogenase